MRGQLEVKAQSRAVARRYARALIDVTRNEGDAAAARLRGEIQGLVTLLETNAELRASVSHPAVPGDTRRRILMAVAQKSGASPLLCRLVELVVDRDRVEMLPAIADAYREELQSEQGILAATATTAVPLDEGQRKALASALCDAVGKKVDLEVRVDPAVLGGVLVRVGGRTYDGTVRGRLVALRQRLVTGR